MKKIVFLYFLFNLFVCNSQILDTTFNIFDNGHFGDNENTNATVNCVKIQLDGKIIIGGSFTTYKGYPCKNIARVNVDGSIDQSFIVGTGFNNAVNDLYIQADGRIIAVGDFGYYNGTTANRIIRLNGDGSIDPTLTGGTGLFIESIKKIIADSSNTYYLAGDFSTYNSIPVNDVVRISYDGQLITSFNPPADFGSFVSTIFLENNNSILIGGYITNYNSSTVNSVIKLDSLGTFDPSFNTAIPPDLIQTIVKDDLDRLYIGGSFNHVGGNTIHKNLARFNSNGLLDITFDTSMDPNSGSVSSLYLSSTGIYIGSPNEYIQKRDYDGLLIQTGLIHGTSLESFNGQLYMGYNSSVQGGIFKIDPTTLMVDHYFGNSGGPNNTVVHVRSLPDGKTIIAGSFTSYNGNPQARYVCRLLQNGELDTTFVSPFFTNYNVELSNIRDLIMLPSGKILLSGTLYTSGLDRMLRLNLDGSIDSGFDLFTLPIDENIKLGHQPDGKIVYTDLISGTGSNSQFKLYRINANGSSDLGFSVSSNITSAHIHKILVRSDGKIFVAGESLSYSVYTNKSFLVFNSDGTPDNVMIDAAAVNGCKDLIFDENENVFVQGIAGNVYKLDHNNQIITTYSFIGPVTKLRLQNDGKLLVVYTISSSFPDPHPISYIVRYTTNGSFDSFDLGGEGSNYEGFSIYDFDVNQYNDIICGGSFTYFNDKFEKNNIARFQTGGILNPCQYLTTYLDSIENTTCISTGYLEVKGNYGVEPYTFQWSSPFSSTSPSIIVSAPGIYTCLVTDANGCSDSISILINGPENFSTYDLNSSLNTTFFRPGFQNLIEIKGYNEACVSSNGTLKLLLDTILQVNSISPAPTSISADTLFWDEIDLAYGGNTIDVSINAYTPPNAQIGDSVSIKMWITPQVGDFDISNNEKFYLYPILNGYDPNIKSVYPIGECIPHFINQDQELTYHIQFQNTGNSEAININVFDTLSQNLDLNSIKIVESTHIMWTEILPDNIVCFHFPNINLPDSTSNEPDSHGGVTFEISPFPDLPMNSLISNRAAIFFDYNEPIITNGVFNTISDGNHTSTETIIMDSCDSYYWPVNGEFYNLSGIYEMIFSNMYGCDSTVILDLRLNSLAEINEIYGISPNPAQDQIKISGNFEIIDVEIINYLGQIVLERKKLKSNEFIDLSQLLSGAYLVRLSNDELSLIQELIVFD